MEDAPPLSKSCVKRYVILPNNAIRWLVVGERKEYFLTPTSCTCHNFMVQLLSQKEVRCKHLRLLHEALRTGVYDEYTLTALEYRELRPYLYGRRH